MRVNLSLNASQLEHLENALAEYTSDGYGYENEEGCFDPATWAEVEELSEMITTARLNMPDEEEASGSASA